MLEKQIRDFIPRLVAVWKEEAARDLAVRVQDLDVKIVSQMGWSISNLPEWKNQTFCDRHRRNDRNRPIHGSNPCR